MSGQPMKRQRRIARTVDALKNLGDLCKEFESDKGMHRRLRNIAKVIMWNLDGVDRKPVKDELKGHPAQVGDDVLDSEDPSDGGVEPTQPTRTTIHGHTDEDIEALLASDGPTEEIVQLAQRRAKEHEVRAMLAAARRLEEVIPHADPRTLAMMAYPLMRSGGVMQDKDPPKTNAERPPGIRVKLSDGRIMELGALGNPNEDD